MASRLAVRWTMWTPVIRRAAGPLPAMSSSIVPLALSPCPLPLRRTHPHPSQPSQPLAPFQLWLRPTPFKPLRWHEAAGNIQQSSAGICAATVQEYAPEYANARLCHHELQPPLQEVARRKCILIKVPARKALQHSMRCSRQWSSSAGSSWHGRRRLEQEPCDGAPGWEPAVS